MLSTKQTKSNRTGSAAEVVELLPNKGKALSSIASMAKKEKKRYF
jgi:hypothetical protein